MRLRTPALVLLALAIALGAYLLLRDSGVPDGGPARPARPDDDKVAGPPSSPPAFSPGHLPLAIPAEALEGGGEDGPREGESPYDALTRQALAQLGPLFRELGDVIAYLDGVPVAEWRKIEVPDEIRDQLLALLAAGTPERRDRAALALSVAELRPEDVARLKSRFDTEMTSVTGEARKNLVLALSFALHTHGDEHGVQGLADALRRGLSADVKDFRNGATLVLALTDLPENAPLLRDLLAADPDRLVRKHAAVGLGRMGGEENQAALTEALVREEDVEVRAWSALASGRAGGDGAALRQALTADPAGEVRGAAAFALSQAGGEGTTAALEAAFYADDHPFTRIGAVAGVAQRNGDGSASEFLAGQGAPYLASVVREEPDTVARFYAVTALGMLPASEDRSSALRQAAASDTNGWVRSTAIGTLAATEGAAARPFLEERLAAEESDRIRAHIQAELDRLAGD